LPHLLVFRLKIDNIICLSWYGIIVSVMDDDLGVPISHIPGKVRQQLELHLDTGTEHTWESLAECMDVNAVKISVSYFFILFVFSILNSTAAKSTLCFENTANFVFPCNFDMCLPILIIFGRRMPEIATR